MSRTLPLRDMLVILYGLTKKQRKLLTNAVIWQLFQCHNEEARRIILGKSR